MSITTLAISASTRARIRARMRAIAKQWLQPDSDSRCLNWHRLGSWERASVAPPDKQT